MFGNKEKNKDTKRVMERNLISKNTSLIGEIKSEGDFRIDGTFEGTLKTLGRVIIGANGFIKGDVEATDAEIEGKFSGQLRISKALIIKATAHISGDVVIGKLSVEPGAVFNATCAMKGAVKELIQTNVRQKTSEKTG